MEVKYELKNPTLYKQLLMLSFPFLFFMFVFVFLEERSVDTFAAGVILFLAINTSFGFIAITFGFFLNYVFLKININNKIIEIRPHTNCTNLVNNIIFIQNYNYLSEFDFSGMVGSFYLSLMVFANILNIVCISWMFTFLEYFIILANIILLIIFGAITLYYYDQNVPISIIIDKKNIEKKIMVVYYHGFMRFSPHNIKSIELRGLFYYMTIKTKGKQKQIKYIAKRSMDELKNCLPDAIVLHELDI